MRCRPRATHRTARNTPAPAKAGGQAHPCTTSIPVHRDILLRWRCSQITITATCATIRRARGNTIRDELCALRPGQPPASPTVTHVFRPCLPIPSAAAIRLTSGLTYPWIAPPPHAQTGPVSTDTWSGHPTRLCIVPGALQAVSPAPARAVRHGQRRDFCRA
jgi:hypothetical protein